MGGNWYAVASVIGAVSSIIGAFLTSGGSRAGFAIIGIILLAYIIFQLFSIYKDKCLAETEARSRERDGLLAELAASRSQTNLWITNHLAHDKEERERHASILDDISKNLGASTELLRSINAGVESGFKTNHEEHSQIRVDIAGI